MKRFVFAAAAALLLLGACSQGNGPLKTEVPARPAGQKSVIALTADPIETVRIGIVGLGMRGSSAVERLSYVPDSKITAICDIEPDMVDRSMKILAGLGQNEPLAFSGAADSWKQLCESDEVDLVYICTDWLTHTPIALYAMEHGKHVAIEVPAANTLEEIWALINTSERTRRHCMMLENCVYDFFEMTTLAMSQAGLFGDVLHVEGAYHHCLDPYWDEYWNNWRLDYNKNNRGDEIGRASCRERV